jgi:hypothetical protein
VASAVSTLVTSSVWVAYGYYAIGEPDTLGVEAELIAQGTSNGLVAAAPGYAVIWTGTQHGRVALTLDLRPDPPPLDVADWDEIVEVSLEFPTGSARVTESGLGQQEDLPNLALAGPGNHRVRCHARGRDFASGLRTPPDLVDAVDLVEEAHLLAIWPAPPAEVVVHQTIDQLGGQRRADAEHALTIRQHDRHNQPPGS